MKEPTTCCLCAGKALFMADGKGYCRVHHAEAASAAKKSSERRLGEMPTASEYYLRRSQINAGRGL